MGGGWGTAVKDGANVDEAARTHKHPTPDMGKQQVLSHGGLTDCCYIWKEMFYQYEFKLPA
jgi:hypothetical protein